MSAKRDSQTERKLKIFFSSTFKSFLITNQKRSVSEMEKIPPDLPLDLLIHIMKLLDIKSFWFFCSCAKIYFSTFNNNILWKHRLAIDYQRQPYLVINERASYKW